MPTLVQKWTKVSVIGLTHPLRLSEKHVEIAACPVWQRVIVPVVVYRGLSLLPGLLSI